ncbi:MAG: hypothetical protein ACXVRW_01040 [Solirubrobacteraceae bacterium]
MRAHAERLPLSLRIAVLVTATAAVCWVVHGVAQSGDYVPAGAVLGDNAAPAIGALIHGHLTAAAARQPLMGVISLVWRAPFAAAGLTLGGDQLAYQLRAVACLLPLLAGSRWLVGRARSPAQGAAAAVATVLITAGPITAAALQAGHPEEVLTALLAAASAICAGQNRRRTAAVLLGLAVGTKPWALLAAPCVLLALPKPRLAPAALAAAVAVPTVGLLPLINPAAYATASHYIGTLNFATPCSLWWQMGARRLDLPGAPVHVLPFSLTRTGATAIAFAVAAAMIWAYARRVRSRHGVIRVDGLALFCVLGLVRCLADPAPVDYYFAALVIPLALWETGIRRRLPALALLVSVVVDRLPEDFAAAQRHGVLGFDLLNIVWLAGGAALAVYLVRSAVGPGAVRMASDPDRRDGQDAGRASGWRGSPSSGIGSQAAA